MTQGLNVPTGAVDVVPGCVFLLRGTLSREECDLLGPRLVNETFPKWIAQQTLKFGWPARTDPDHHMSRFGDPGVTYAYKGKPKPIHPFTPALCAVRERVIEALGWRPNCVVVNSYMSGAGLYPHRDGAYIPQLGDRPTIVSVSFGATRTFRLHPCDPVTNKRSKDAPHTDVRLVEGDMLVMHGECDRLYHHSLPEEPEVTGVRLSLTFRRHLEV